MRFEYRTLPDDTGAVRFFAEQVVPAHGVPGYVGTISDFTDLVTARGDLRKAETLYRNTFDQAPIGIAYADRDGKFLRFNDAFCTLLGFNAVRVHGQVDRRVDARGGCGERPSAARSPVERGDPVRRYREALPPQGRQLRVGAHDHRAGTRRQPRRMLGRIPARHHPSQGARGRAAAAADAARSGAHAICRWLCWCATSAGNITHYNRAAVDLYCIPQARAASQDPYPLAADVYLMDGVTAVDRADRPLACALRGETVTNLELIDRAARLEAGALHVVECAPADRPGRADPRRRRRHSGRDGSEAPGDGTRARAQGADDRLAPGRHGRGRHQCAAQRRQHPQQRQHLGESRRRARQAIESARCIAPRRHAGRAGPPRGPIHHRRRARAGAYPTISPRSGNSCSPISG